MSHQAVEIDLDNLTTAQIEEYIKQGYNITPCVEIKVTRKDGSVEIINENLKEDLNGNSSRNG